MSGEDELAEAADARHPGYGDMGQPPTRPLLACLQCGAGVLDTEVHDAWHLSQTAGSIAGLVAYNRSRPRLVICRADADF